MLCAVVEVLVGNPQEITQRPGKKTDKADATWIAALLAHGLIRPSFLPPPLLRAWRDLTRSRVGFVQRRSQAQNRVYTILEDTNIKLAGVVSDLFGRSGRLMLDALITGKRDAHKMAKLAKRRLRRKVPQLARVLQG
jgi:transposase